MRFNWMVRFAALGCLLLMMQACGAERGLQQDEADPGFMIYLVRHAEKLPEGADPGLAPEGEDRAEKLAELLEGAGIQTVWSTDYNRTRNTATPLANALGLEVQLYNPTDLEGFADRLVEDQQTVLVVGHSNTTPELAAALGGEAGEPIDEAGEYDRLYVLTGVGTDVVQTEIQRFGAPYERQHGPG